MVEKRAGSPKSSPMTRERRSAMASNNVKKEENEDSTENNHDNGAHPSKLSEDMEKIKDEFVQLGRDLNMDVSTSDAAWSSYEEIKQKYTLEVRRLKSEIHLSNPVLLSKYHYCNYITISFPLGQSNTLVGVCIVCGLPKFQFAYDWKLWRKHRWQWSIPYTFVTFLQFAID